MSAFTISAASKRGVRIVFASILAWSGLSISAVQLSGVEPWPAWLFPGFEGAPATPDEVVVREPEITITFTGDSTQQVTAGELLRGVLREPARVLDSAFSQGLDENGMLTRAEPRSLIERVLKGATPGQTAWGTARAHDPATKDWLLSQIEADSGRSDALELRIEWWSVRRTTDTREELGRVLEQTVIIDLRASQSRELSNG